MDEKEKELLENELQQDVSGDVDQQESAWEFDSAPTLADNLVVGDEFEIELPADKPSPAPVIEQVNEEPVPPKTQKNGDVTSFVLTAIIAVLLAFMLGFLGYRYYTVPNTEEKMNPGNIAVTVGDTPVSIGMYNYCYNNLVNRVISSGMVDTSIPYDQQTTTNKDGETVTWAQYFQDITVEYLKEVTSYYEAGVDAGIELSEEDLADIEEQLSYVKETAASNNMSVNSFTQDSYGEYCGLATLEKMLIQHTIASVYQQKLKIDITCTQEEVDTYFEENSDDYYQIPMGFAFIAFDETNKDQAVADAQSYCDQINSLTDLKTLVPSIYKDMIDEYVAYGYFDSADECALEIAENLEVTVTKNDTSYGEEVTQWLFDANTKVNDCSYFVDEESGYIFIVLKVGNAVLNEDTVYSVRHILIMPEPTDEQTTSAAAGGSVEYTQEQWDAAKAKAMEIYDEFNNGDKSEYSFALLAEKYSDDTESTSHGSSGLYGGLYESVELGYMVPDFENWSIDDSRKYGDTGVVNSDYGCHIMFFVSKTQSYRFECENALKMEKMADVMSEYRVKLNKHGMKLTETAEISQ